MTTATVDRQQRIAATASQYKVTTALLAVVLFPFQLVGWLAAVVWIVVTFAVAAVQVSFGEATSRLKGPPR